MSNFLKSSTPAAPQPAGPVQQDGNVIAQTAAPTKAPLQSRSASPAHMNTSGLERAMGAHADKVHPVKRR